jgi:hypothetical protein
MRDIIVSGVWGRAPPCAAWPRQMTERTGLPTLAVQVRRDQLRPTAKRS